MTINQESGFSIVFKPEVFAKCYHCGSRGQREKALPDVKLAAYKGVSRIPFDIAMIVDESGQLDLPNAQFLEHIGFGMVAAQKMFDSILATHSTAFSEQYPGKNIFYLANALENFDFTLFLKDSDMHEVFESITKKEDFEKAIFRRANYTYNENTLGFDIGCWAGDHYSIICDCAGSSDTHLPQVKDAIRREGFIKSLNKHMLFDSIDDALRFKDYYLSQRQGDSEVFDDFEIIQIESLA